VRLVLVTLLALVVAGCGGTATEPSVEPSAESKPPKSSDAVPAKKTAPPCANGSTRKLVSPVKTFAAVVQERAEAFRKPGSGRLATFGPENVNGVATVFAVLAERVDSSCDAKWYRVRLPLKPNGITGWVRAGEVELVEITARIHVDLSERRVTLYERGRRVLSATAAIGTPQTPTPTGRYYVNQRLIPTDTSGPFGPGAIGISAFSEVLTGWVQGGPIAIHGTNRPDLIGRAVSNGCIRVRNDLLLRLFEKALAGTPVTVRA
jgi:lipoprotein-anchoring transpeptidase ErfK/SrfK